MEKVIKKLLVATGLTLSAAVALLPLTSYAEAITDTSDPHGVYNCDDTTGSNACANSDGSTTVTVNIQPILAIGDGKSGSAEDVITSGGDVIRAFPGLLKTGTFTTSVRSALPFEIQLSSTLMTNVDAEEYIIPAKDITTDSDRGKSAWGIKKITALGEDSNSNVYSDTYFALPSNTGTPFFDSGTAAQDDFKKFDFPIGVTASETLPQGVYEATVTVTAVVKPQA